MNQIIQNFHTKAALMICSARASLPRVYNKNGDVRQNRWFNTVLDDTDALVQDLQEWKRPDLADHSPPPLVVEVYLDASHLTHNQALVLVDDTGKRWDVADALATSRDSSPRPTKSGSQHCEVVLERWMVQLGEGEDYTAAELNDQLPNVYKKGVVLFRSLYTYQRLLPAWKLHKKLRGRQSNNQQGPKLKFRIKQGHGAPLGKDSLYTPLCPADAYDNVTEQHHFAPLLCPAGPLKISVSWRTNCDFTIADAEALLSSRFQGFDEQVTLPPAGRSLPGARIARPLTSDYGVGAATAGVKRSNFGAYGSLGNYRTTGERESPAGASTQPGSGESDTMFAQQMAERRAKEAREGEVQTGRGQVIARSTSTNYMENPPFKAGSLSSSPRFGSKMQSPSPSSSLGKGGTYMKTSAQSTSHQKRASLNTLPQQALRAGPSFANETAIASSGSSSPKPAPVHRYSSSFADRKTKKPAAATGSSSKVAESNTSSGRASSSSKEKSGQLGKDGSNGSAKTDEDDIADFISLIEQKKDLKAFRPRPASRDNPNTVNLSKYSILRDGSSQLAEEMSSSSLVHQQQTPSTPPSRRLSNVPGLSTSSSPSRAGLSYQPYVRSRLSTHSIVEERGGEGLDPGTAARTGSQGSSSLREQPQQGSTGAEERGGEEEDEMLFPFSTGM
ncbi:hypothetical protein MBLNU230_g8581t2 [Neophaeotheca triangularis]